MNKYMLAFMAFLCIVNFTSIINGFVYFHGIEACIPWLLTIILYFLPYALMVGELSTCFRHSEGGLTTWINKTINTKVGFFCGWFYLILYVIYLSQRSNIIVLALNWMVHQNGDVSGYSVWFVQGVGLVLILLAALFALKGAKVFDRGSSIAGMAAFGMMIMFIAIGLFSIFSYTGVDSYTLYEHADTTSHFTPDLLVNLSILIFAVGGAEKLSPYVNRMKNPGRDFGKSMIILVILVSICILFGTVVLSYVFDINNLPQDILANGQYYCFQELGQSLGLGNILVVVYAAVQLLCQFFITVISLDAPIRMFMSNTDTDYIPNVLHKKNKNGVYVNMLLLNVVIVAIIVMLPCFGAANINEVVAWFVELSGACMPLGFVFVFVAYIALKIKSDKFKSPFVFIKNKYIAIAVASFCGLITLVFCFAGLIEERLDLTIVNFVILGILIATTWIIPLCSKISKWKNQKNK